MKTYEEINEKIRRRKAVVVTAEEIIDIIDRRGYKKAAGEVDVVTTGTFGAMCSSGAFLNFGHSRPRINGARVHLNGVEAYAGIAAADCYLGAAQTRCLPSGIHRSSRYGGGHVIEDLAAGRKVRLQVQGRMTDCYPARSLTKDISLHECPDAFLFSPRNCCQNYNCAVNSSGRKLYTYMGILKPDFGNAVYSGAGELSPLMNDPFFRTVGVGTRIFLGGGTGYVTGPGTQHLAAPNRNQRHIPLTCGGTLAVTGNLKTMSHRWLRGVYIKGYGTSLMVGLAVPIPVLDEGMAYFVSVRNRDIHVPVIDYSSDYPAATGAILTEVNREDIARGEITVDSRRVPVYLISNIKKAREAALILKNWIQRGEFLLSRPAESLPAAEGT